MASIIVTGGAGFLGSWFVREWIAQELGDVTVIDKLTYASSLGSLESVRSRSDFQFHRGDIADSKGVTAILEQAAPSAVLNFAAETHVDRSIDAPAPFVATNIVGTAALLDAVLVYWNRLPPSMRESFRFLHVSTDEVYGPIPAPHTAQEDAPYRPSSPYAASKAAADHLVRAYTLTYGLPTLIAHPVNCLGPFQFPEKLVPLAILNALESRPIPIYGDGLQRRDWLWGGDLAAALRAVLLRGQPGESFHIAAGHERTNLDLARDICTLVDELRPGSPRKRSDLLITHVADRPGHDVRYALDASRIRATGWKPTVDFDSALRETVLWYIANDAWVAEMSRRFDRSQRIGIFRG